MRKKEKEKTKSPPSEFCEVCRLSHNQGRKHRYFPNHAKALSAVLSRFQSKLSGIKSSLKDPSLLLPLHADHTRRNSRLWCVFCALDLVPDAASSFACEDAIRHLASAEHLRNLKEFLWKHGGGMDRIDSFRVSDANLLKWEKKCEALRSGLQSLSGGLGGSMQSSLKDIHYQINSSCTDVLDTNAVRCFESTFSCGVIPLQSLTNEGCLPPYKGAAKVSDGASVSYAGASSSMGSMQQDLGMQSMSDTRSMVDQWTAASGNRQVVTHHSSCGMDQRLVSGKEWGNGFRLNSCFEGLSPLLRIHAEGRTSSQAINLSTSASPSSQSGKLPKLNPKRVGAAWAEKRRKELEMEMRGEIVISYDPNWLPNFGGVWQAGTRKESRKEFEVEKRKNIKRSNQPETSVIQPYISKRMRLCSKDGENSSYFHID